jgi:hypothetical protein
MMTEDEEQNLLRRLQDLVCRFGEDAHHADNNRLVAEAEGRAWDAERLGAEAATLRDCAERLREVLA